MRILSEKVHDQRKKHLLQWAIHYHIRTSKPVASQSVVEEGAFDLSGATIRKILKELEDEGYLAQPHTSSGRVPTDKGYRFYVDYLTDVQRLALTDKERIQHEYERRVEELDGLLAQTSKLLSRASHSAGLVLAPRMERHVLRRFEILPVGPRRAVAVLVTQTGLIRHFALELASTPPPHRLQALNRMLNDRLRDRPVAEALKTIEAEMETLDRELREMRDLAHQALQEVAHPTGTDELFMEGTSNILAHPEEFEDFKEMQALLKLMEERHLLAETLEMELDALAKEGASPVSVRIGRENRSPALRSLSLVTSTYRVGEQPVGVLAVLGSKRMEYSRVMALVDYISRQVTRALKHWDLPGHGEREGEGGRKR